MITRIERNPLLIFAGLLYSLLAIEAFRLIGQVAFAAEQLLGVLLRVRIPLVVPFVSVVALAAGAVMMSAFTAAVVKTSRPHGTAVAIAVLLAGVLAASRDLAPNWLPGVSVTANVLVPAALAGTLFLVFRRVLKPQD